MQLDDEITYLVRGAPVPAPPGLTPRPLCLASPEGCVRQADASLRLISRELDHMRQQCDERVAASIDCEARALERCAHLARRAARLTVLVTLLVALCFGLAVL